MLAEEVTGRQSAPTIVTILQVNVEVVHDGCLQESPLICVENGLTCN